MAVDFKPLHILHTIKKFIAPLSPPVNSFEASIRSTPFRILISVLLSARTKDPVTEKAAARLFAAADTPDKMARLPEARIGRLIYPVGFYRTKAKHILGICRALEQGGRFPATLDELLELPGIGRKTANLVLALAFGVPAIAVDTHVFRISRRLGWADGRTPQAVELELQKIFPRRQWPQVNQVLVGFGQTICRPVSPKCADCVLKKICPSSSIKSRGAVIAPKAKTIKTI
jgi:endonuclease III